ncbi:hypothetical protein F5Y05DRAFT_240414 [Hypoxylon sp. FL0543]|nr:hypothetical protein F5Y05DRAFT_240414 [Hypoxylon sp. FL0543]
MPGFTVASVAATSARRGSREPRQPREAVASRPPQQLPGCILWLPPKEELRGNREECDSDLEVDRCNHPVVVLSPQAENGKVVYLMITSLKDKDLQQRFKRNPSLRLEHLPIRPCRPHPDNGILLSLEDVTQELRKKSYVKTKKQHRILLTSLQPYERRGPDYILSRKSYQQLIQYAKFSPPTPHPTSNSVPAPVRVVRNDQPRPITRERRGSYGEYVASLRGLEVGPTSPPRAQHLPVANTNAGRYPHVPIRTERAPLLAVSSYRPSYASHPGTYSGSYPGGYPAYASTPSFRLPEPPEPFNWWRFWKKLFLFVVGFAGAYATYRCLYWLAISSRESGSVIKNGIDFVVSRIGDLWSRVGELVRPQD